MAYALTALFEDSAIDPRQFTIFRDDNTLDPVDIEQMADSGKATGLDVSDLVQLKPQRIAEQWLAARIPFDIKIDDDAHFLLVADHLHDQHVFSSAEDESVENRWNGLVNDLENFRSELKENVSKAVEQTFDGVLHPDANLEVFEVVHQIRRLITLRSDLGFCDFNDGQVKALTASLAETFFYNREANETIGAHIEKSIQNAIETDNDLEALPEEKREKKKHIHVSGGQGAGKTFLSRRSLGIQSEENSNAYIRVNKDLFRPLVLSAEDAKHDLDLSQCADRRQYGRVTEDELNMIKAKQWQIISEHSDAKKLPNLHIDSTAIKDVDHVELLTQNGNKMTLLHVNTPFEVAERRVQDRALGDGIPGIDSLRESLHSEMMQGHRAAAVEAASMLIHGVGKPVKLKILDGQSSAKTRPVQAQANLEKGVLKVYNARAILEVFHKAQDGKTDITPSDKDLRKQIPNFEKIASVMTKIDFHDPRSKGIVAIYDNGAGMQILDQERFEDEFGGTLTEEVLSQLDTFYNSKKAVILSEIAKEEGRVFEKREPFGQDEPLKIITDQYETEVPLVDRSSYVDDDAGSKILEWRHLAKRGKFLDGSFSPWQDKAPTDMRLLSARGVVDKWLTDDIVEQIVDRTAQAVRDKGKSKTPTTIHIAHPLKDSTRPGVNINHMVLSYREELAKRLNNAMAERHTDLSVTFKHDRPMLALASDRSTRTTASALQRLTSQPFYDPDIFDDGDLVLFADEHVQAGGVMLAARNIQNNVDIDVIGYTALSSHNLGADLRINPNISIALETAIEDSARLNDTDAGEFRDDLDTALEWVGLSRDTLSNIEGLILIAYVIDGQNEAKRSWFESVKANAGLDDTKVREGMDSLEAILLDDAVTPYDLGEQMHDQIMRSRKAVYPSMIPE